jgi:hypothetical protein
VVVGFVLAGGHMLDMTYLLAYALVVVPLIALIGSGFAGELGRAAPWLVLPRVGTQHPDHVPRPPAGARQLPDLRAAGDGAERQQRHPGRGADRLCLPGRAAVLTIWDVASRRAVFPVRGGQPVATGGLAGRPVQVEQEATRPRLARIFLTQWAEPFTTSEVAER